MEAIVISVDGTCTGRRCACAAVATQNSRIIGEGSRNLPEAGDYVLAAELSGVALAARLLRPADNYATIIVETDHPDVPRLKEWLNLIG